MRGLSRRWPVAVRVGLDRRTVWRAGEREVAVVAAYMALGWRRRAGGGGLGLVHPLYVLDRTAGTVRRWPVVDVTLVALVAAVVAWGALLGGGRARRGGD
jgi:hypothetical protein